jgi:hypothetical protein
MNIEKNEWGQRKPPQGEARGGWSEGEQRQKRLFMEHKNLRFRNPGAPPSYLVDRPEGSGIRGQSLSAKKPKKSLFFKILHFFGNPSLTPMQEVFTMRV